MGWLDLELSVIITRVVVLLTAFSVHEFAHAWTANAFGDDTPRLYGRLTLNPAAHLDVIGSLMLIVAGFGWAKPVPVNPYLLRRRSPSALMWVALAGPLSNLLMAVIAAVPFKLGLLSLSYQIGSFLPNLPQLLLAFVSINLVLMLFNLIPLAPLDGEKVVDYFFPPTWGRVWEQIRPYGPMILMALMFIAPMIGLDIIGWIIYPPLQALLNLLVG